MKFDAKADNAGSLKFTYAKEKDVLVVTLSGSMDSLTAPDFTKEIDEKLSAGEESFIVNLNGLEHLSSAGLRNILITLKKIAGSKKKMLFVSSNEDVNRIFKMAGVHNTMIKIYESNDAALSA
ncbi:MAG: STAS domain-containing protein [Candidatus Magnetominusculus sp. LBB02]|nr:STAS domain-containing protein [Candidatus Magnetominusculus sp. LBB02]